jgi:phosphoribosyl-ATP pyrophosphohydrolase
VAGIREGHATAVLAASIFHFGTFTLFAKGTAKIAQKVGEEAVEALIEAMRGDNAALVAESSDLLYHLLVLWADRGIDPADVWAALKAREGISGIAEKAARREAKGGK